MWRDRKGHSAEQFPVLPDGCLEQHFIRHEAVGKNLNPHLATFTVEDDEQTERHRCGEPALATNETKHILKLKSGK